MTVLAPVLAALIGLIVYALATGKAMELGRLAFACGLLVALLMFGKEGVRLFP